MIFEIWEGAEREVERREVKRVSGREMSYAEAMS